MYAPIIFACLNRYSPRRTEPSQIDADYERTTTDI